MKNFKYIIGILFIALAMGCQDDSSDTTFADKANAPQNLTALFTITQDNSGLVTIAPHGEGVTSFELYFGDATTEPVSLNVGEKTNHTYAEGTYNVRLIGKGINGKTTEVSLPLTVSFIAPENLAVTVATVVGNPFKVNVTAKADYETYFDVTFGENAATPAVQFNEGQTASYTYTNTGTYTVTVTAYSGGAATAKYTQEVTISNPMVLPITFQDQTLDYTFSDFGNAVTTVVDNPDATGINTSTKVAKQVKKTGSETWAGSLLTLDTPITNLATAPYFKVKVWSPKKGITFKLKLENLADATINYEVDAVSTVENQWEELTYNFTKANANQSYSNVIMFCNFNVIGAEDTYYFDDIIQTSTGTPLELPITFENAALNYTFTDFQGTTSSLVNNPDATAANNSSKVMKVFKNSGSDIWAGSFISLTNPLDFTTQHVIKMKVYSPAAGIHVIFKFEKNDDANTNIERNVATTVANGWEEMTFDFTGINSANNYQKIVVFFNAGIAGKGDTYYFDDIKLTN